MPESQIHPLAQVLRTRAAGTNGSPFRRCYLDRTHRLFAYLPRAVVAFHDLRVFTVQLAAEGVLITFALVGMTAWGRTRRLALFHCCYALVLIVYEWTVCYKNVFTTIWGDGFAEAFGFYCLLIPVSVSSTVLVGVAALLLMSIPEAVFTNSSMAGVLSLIGNLPLFAILAGSQLVRRNVAAQVAAIRPKHILRTIGTSHSAVSTLFVWL